MPGVGLSTLNLSTVLGSGGGGVTIPVASSPTITPVGDSRVPVFLDPATKRQKGATDLSNVACALADQRYTLKSGYGASGQTVAQYLSNLPAAIADNPGVIFLPSVLNSLAANVTGAEVFNQIKTAVDSIIAANIVALVGSEIGSTALTAPQLVQAGVYNDLIQAYAQIKQNLVFIDFRPALCTAGVIKAEYRYDSGHLNQRGALIGGEVLKAVLDVIMPAGNTFILGNDNLPAIGGYTQLALNPRFQVATGGATTTGATGTFAANCNFNKTGASTALAVTSTVGRARLACTFGAQNDNCRMSTAASNAAWAPGDTVRAAALVEVSDPNGLAGVQLTLVANGDTGSTTWTDMFATATWAGPDHNYHMLMLTQNYVIPAMTTKNSLAATVQANAFAAGAGTLVDVLQISILKKNP